MPERDRRQKRNAILAVGGVLGILRAGGTSGRALGVIAIHRHLISARAGLGPAGHFGSGLRLADLRRRLVARGAQALRRDPGAVRGVGAVLGVLRAGRLVAEPVCRAEHQPPCVRFRLSGELVSVRAADLRGGAGPGIRLAVAGAPPKAAGAFQSRRSSRSGWCSPDWPSPFWCPPRQHGGYAARRSPCGG